MHVIGPSAVYFAIVFAAGFALGVVRTLVVSPALGPAAAVAVELPVILLVSWYACRWTLDRFSVPATTIARLGMGTIAFSLLMAAEFELAVAMTYFAPDALPRGDGRAGTIAACFLSSLTTPDRLLGLTGQIVFALMPWISLHVPKR